MSATPDIYINRFEIALAAEVNTVEDSHGKGRIRSDPALLRRAGFNRHRVAEPGTDSYSFAERAVRAPELDGRRVERVVLATTFTPPLNSGDEDHTTDDSINFGATPALTRAGLTEAEFTGLAQLGCAGLLRAIDLARHLAASGDVVYVSADRAPHGTAHELNGSLLFDGV